MSLKSMHPVIILVFWIADLLFTMAVFFFLPESIDFHSSGTYFVLARGHLALLIWFLGAIPLGILTALWLRARSK